MIELKDIKQLVGMEYFLKSLEIKNQNESRLFNSTNCVATNMITRIKTIK